MRRPLAALAFLWLPLADASLARDDAAELADDIELVVLQREVLSIDARGGGQRSADLELSEKVLWTGVRGQVGVVLTDRRVLAVTTRSGSFQEKRYRRTEPVPDPPLMGGRVALLVTRTRVIGFDGGAGALVERETGPGESVLDWVAGDNVAVAVTDRRALGLSSARGGFFQIGLQPGERLVSVSAVANSATVATSRRLLIFRGPSGSWEERRLDLR